MDYKTVINNPWIDKEERLDALRAMEKAKLQRNAKTGEINNHIHTIYSFSPYTPSMAVLEARNAGLEAAGSVDHDSIAAAEELTAAAAEMGIGGCVGFEVRVSFKTGAGGREGPFAGRKINNPDSAGIAYMTVQGVPAPRIKEVRAFLDPIRKERLERTREMVRGANALLAWAGLEEIDFKHDVEDCSKYAEGGVIT